MTNVIIAAMAVILQIESNNGRNNIGDGGRAVGCYQIHPIAVREVNRLYGTSYSYKDRWCPVKSREMCRLTLEHHYRRGATNVVDLARKWNRPYGGVNQAYRRKVMRIVRVAGYGETMHR